MGEANGLAVDWVSRHVYWTDAARRSVEVAEYDGSNRRVLTIDGLQAPRGIVVDPNDGYRLRSYHANKLSSTVHCYEARLLACQVRALANVLVA